MKDGSEWHICLMSTELKGVEKQRKIFLFFGHLFSTTIIVVNLEVIGLASFSTYREKSVICVWQGEFNLFFLT